MNFLIPLFAFSLTLTRTGSARPTSEDRSVYTPSDKLSTTNEIVLQSDSFYGWERCSVVDRSRIEEAIHDSRDILSVRTVLEFSDWRQTPDAVQIFGQAVANDYHGWSSMVQRNFKNALSFAAGTSDEKIQVFCHDGSMNGPLKDECSSTRQPDSVVVARNYLGRPEPALMLLVH